MRPVCAYARSALFGTVAASALFVATGLAQAGGFAVREQSTSAQGSSFAGSAAGYDLSSSFWNPAAFGIAGWGVSSESHIAIIIPNGELNGTATVAAGVPVIGGSPVSGANSTDTCCLAAVPASYYAYRFNKDLVLGLSINSPFGLATKPDNTDWVGRSVGRSSHLFTVNAAPTLSYQVAPGLFVGAGVQLEYMSLLFKFAAGPPGGGGAGALVRANPPAGSASAYLDVDDNLGVGYTAGVLWQPSRSTSIGLGFRSSVSHDLDGTVYDTASKASASAKFETPEIVTLSVRQAISPRLRALGTIEWTNWSRLSEVPVAQNLITSPFAPNGLVLSAHWHDSWLFSGGLEYDVNRQLTVRGGVAFEKSPIQNATERLIQVPDSDRWWLSAGLTYALSPKIAIDLAYTHIFFDDAPFDRMNLGNTVHLVGEADQSADIVSASLKMKW
jgi:long-chain fatty acid transport protein